MDGSDWTREPTDWANEKFMTIHAVIEDVGLCKSKIHVMMAEGKFPKQFKVDSRSFWLRSQVAAWKKAKVKENETLPWKDKWIHIPRTKGEKRVPKPVKPPKDDPTDDSSK